MESWKKRFKMKAVVAVLAVMTVFLTACSGQSAQGALGKADKSGTGSGNFAGRTEIAADGGFAVHFIDVGQADSALVLCDGESMLIDGGNAADSDLVYSYLEDLSVDYLDYIVCTHAHEDHVGGLSGALNYAKIGTALAPVTEYSSKAFKNFAKYVEEQGKEITVPSPGDTFSLGSAQVEVFGPITPSDDPNNTSIVLKVIYGDTSFLFTGDAEREEEQDILNAGYPLKSTVLKVGHHGSDTSTSYPFLREIMPTYGVISVGKGNSYGHPTDDTLSRLRDAGVTVYRTDELGHIVCVSDGTNVEFYTGDGSIAKGEVPTVKKENGTSGNSKETASEDKTDEPTKKSEYILNKNSRKIHLPSCRYAKEMSEENRESYVGSKEKLIQNGYEACGVCKP